MVSPSGLTARVRSIHAQNRPAKQGRAGDRWCREAAGRPAPELVRLLALTGFQAIWVDRAGYPDQAAALEADLTRLLGSPRVNFQNRIAVYNLAEFADRGSTVGMPHPWAPQQ